MLSTKMLAFNVLLDSLRTLLPPAGVVHVGAGSGAGTAVYAGWGARRVLLVEADARFAAGLQAATQSRAGWSTHTALLGDAPRTVVFHQATHPAESGILPAEELARWWPRLKTHEQRELPATTLPDLLQAAQVPAESLNWLVVDCLPALPVIQGAAALLPSWDVVIARVLLEKDALPSLGASHGEVEAYLASQGYRCLGIEEERHPAFGRALFVRQWKQAAQAQGKEISALRAVAAQSESQAVQLRAEATEALRLRDVQAQLVAKRQQEIAALTQALDDETKLAAQRQQQIESLTQQCDAQSKLDADRQTRIEQLTTERDDQAKLAAERQRQIASLTQQRDAQAKLAAERQHEISVQVQARDGQARLVEERRQQVEALTQERDTFARQTADRLAEHDAEVQTLKQARDQAAAQAEQAAKALDEQAKLAQELQAQVEQLLQAKAAAEKLASDKEALMERADKERAGQFDALQRKLAECESSRTAALKQVAESDARQVLLDSEIMKAEAQLDLIKDVILREKNF